MIFISSLLTSTSVQCIQQTINMQNSGRVDSVLSLFVVVKVLVSTVFSPLDTSYM